MAFDDSNSAFAFDSNHADGTKGGQVVLLVDPEQLAEVLPVFAGATHVSIIEFMGVLFSRQLAPGTAEVELVVDEETLTVHPEFLDRFATDDVPHPSNVVLRFPKPGERSVLVHDVRTAFPRDYVYCLGASARGALRKQLRKMERWLEAENGTKLRLK